MKRIGRYFFNKAEREAINKFVEKYPGKTEIPTFAIQDLCDILNVEHHDGNEVRKYANMNGLIYKIRIGKPTWKKDQQEYSRPKPEPKTAAPKGLANTPALHRLVVCANGIKSLADEFCKTVLEFQAEFERDRTLLKRLAKLREAARELQPYEL
jgi:hypothetical protein